MLSSRRERVSPSSSPSPSTTRRNAENWHAPRTRFGSTRKLKMFTSPNGLMTRERQTRGHARGRELTATYRSVISFILEAARLTENDDGQLLCEFLRSRRRICTLVRLEQRFQICNLYRQMCIERTRNVRPSKFSWTFRATCGIDLKKTPE